MKVAHGRRLVDVLLHRQLSIELNTPAFLATAIRGLATGYIGIYTPSPNQSTLIFYVVVLSPWPRTNSFIPTQIKFLTTPLTAMLLLRHIPNSGDARLNSCSQWFRRQQKRNVVVLSTCTICQVSTWTVSLCLAADWAHTAVGRSTTLARQSGTRCQMNLEIETVCQFR